MKKILIITLIGLNIVGCGNNTDKKAKQETMDAVKKEVKQEPIIEDTKVESSTADGTTIILSSNDMMQFDKTELRAKASQKITLTLKHTGKMDKTVMGHNFVLLNKGTDVAEFATKAMSATDTDYIPEGDEVIAHTKVIGGGESVTITFDAPAKGTYEYICSFPAHYGLMRGKFIIE